MNTITLLSAWLPLLASALPNWSHGSPPHGPPPSDPLVISTSSGRVHGKVDPALPNVHQYLGIPYAVPPIGNLRWTAPQLLDQPTAQIEATELPISCMQFLTNQGNTIFVREILETNIQGLNKTGAVSEDCLTVSVYTPSNATGQHGWHERGRHLGGSSEETGEESSKGLPVFIYFYGGAFKTGGQNVPYWIPAQWVNRTSDHIVVTFNYRVNIFGFPNAAGLGEQNFGLLDQRAAVEWVKANIAAFGGDPMQMIAWGQSAGSASVDYYNYAYATDPIVKGLIMDSGTAFMSSHVPDQTHSNYSFVAEHVGCGGLAADPTAQLACMRSVNATVIEDFIAAYTDNATIPAIAFSPIADNKTVFSNYTERALAGKQAQIPAIIGTDRQDGVPYVPFHLTGPTNQTAVLGALDSAFFCPATESSRLRQETNLLTYRFLHAGNFSNIAPAPWMGAFHGSELPLIFGTHPNYRGNSTELEYDTSFAYQDAWLAFAKDPVNGLKAQDWMPYTQMGAEQVREFGRDIPAQDVSLADIESTCVGPVPERVLPVYTGICC